MTLLIFELLITLLSSPTLTSTNAYASFEFKGLNNSLGTNGQPAFHYSLQQSTNLTTTNWQQVIKFTTTTSNLLMLDQEIYRSTNGFFRLEEVNVGQ